MTGCFLHRNFPQIYLNITLIHRKFTKLHRLKKELYSKCYISIYMRKLDKIRNYKRIFMAHKRYVRINFISIY